MSDSSDPGGPGHVRTDWGGRRWTRTDPDSPGRTRTDPDGPGRTRMDPDGPGRTWIDPKRPGCIPTDQMDSDSPKIHSPEWLTIVQNKASNTLFWIIYHYRPLLSKAFWTVNLYTIERKKNQYIKKNNCVAVVPVQCAKWKKIYFRVADIRCIFKILQNKANTTG